MEVAIITDQHFGVRNDSKVFLDNQTKFYENVFFPTLVERNITHILDLGDSFDRRKYINFNTLVAAKEMFYDKVKERGMTMDIIIGNHTTYFKNTNHINTMNILFSEEKHINIYYNDAAEIEIGGCKILLVPWITPENQDRIFQEIDRTDASICMGHFEISGFEMLRGQVCDHGLNKDVFTKFNEVYSGHFHHPSEHGNIRFLGAPYEMTWSDYGGKRGFHIFDTETHELEFIANPYNVFEKVFYDDTDMTVENMDSYIPNHLTNKYVKVIIKERNNSYLFDLFLDKLQNMDIFDIKVVEDTLNLADINEDDLIDEAQDTGTILLNYIDNLETDIDKSVLKNSVSALYKEALSL